MASIKTSLKELITQVRDLEEKIGKCNDQRDRYIKLQAAKLAAGKDQCDDMKTFVKFAKDCGMSKAWAYKLVALHEGKITLKELRKQSAKSSKKTRDRQKSTAQETNSDDEEAKGDNEETESQPTANKNSTPEDIVFAIEHRISTVQSLATDTVELVKLFSKNNFTTAKKTKSKLEEMSSFAEAAIIQWSKVKRLLDAAIEADHKDFESVVRRTDALKISETFTGKETLQ